MLYAAILIKNKRTEPVVARIAVSLATIDSAKSRMHAILGFSAVLAIIFSLVSSWLLASFTTQHLGTIIDVARDLGKGNFSRRTPDFRESELGDLARVINDMAEHVERSIAVRRDFVANVSHELRTPIAVISGYAETVVSNRMVETDPERAEHFVRTIQTHAARLNRLLEDILQLSRLEGDSAGLSLQLWRLEDVLRSVCPLFEQRLSDKGVALVMSGIEGCFVMADRERLEQVFVNLLDNALKYTQSGGKISINARTTGERVEITVADNGIGIPKEHLSRIFERFYRVDPARSRELGGTGLGLAIVKHVVQLHGGVIDVSSKPGHGTAFSFTLPAA
jgi:two-component system phosphate regulon sensor histidine kinase PhoR